MLEGHIYRKKENKRQTKPLHIVTWQHLPPAPCRCSCKRGKHTHPACFYIDQYYRHILHARVCNKNNYLVIYMFKLTCMFKLQHHGK